MISCIISYILEHHLTAVPCWRRDQKTQHTNHRAQALVQSPGLGICLVHHSTRLGPILFEQMQQWIPQVSSKIVTQKYQEQTYILPPGELVYVT